ncbi:hypothetical protein [Methylomonas sp. AM2-LC]|uniref:hypothetical protein n=1 Tax=Methylomonas sp. AM2-LC TaxID=3153301 RepID=UPI003266A23D
MSIISIRAVIGLAMTLLAPVSESHQVAFQGYCYPDETTAFLVFDAQGFVIFQGATIDPIYLVGFSVFNNISTNLPASIKYTFYASQDGTNGVQGGSGNYYFYLPLCDNYPVGSINIGQYSNLQTVLDGYFVPDETLITEIIGDCILLFILGLSARYIVSALTIR